MYQVIKSRRDKLKLLRFIQDNCDNEIKYFNIAKRLIDDPDPTTKVRWQALIAIGNYIETYPEKVWKIITKYGCSAKSDMRTGVATVLLEHLLDYKFDTYFTKCKKLVESEQKRFLDTMSFCLVMKRKYKDILHKYIKKMGG